MARYIDADKCEKTFSEIRKNMKPKDYNQQEFEIRDNVLLNVEQIIHVMPPADVQEVKHGKWKQVQAKSPKYMCTKCLHLFNNKSFKYCPNCGAKMDKE